MSAPQVVDNDLIADGHEGLIYTVTASAAGPEQAQRRFPFVGAGGRVTGLSGFLLTKRTGKASARPRNKDRNKPTFCAGVRGVLGSVVTGGGWDGAVVVAERAVSSERSDSILLRAFSHASPSSANLASSRASS